MSSSDVRVKRDDVLEWAMVLMRRLAPACEKIKIAGSLRRGDTEIGDVEMVVLPRRVEILERDIDDLVQFWVDDGMLTWDTAVVRRGARYKRLLATAFRGIVPGYAGLPVEIFAAARMLSVNGADGATEVCNFGNTLAIRTGDKDFSHLMVTPVYQGGLMPAGLRQEDGFLWKGSVPLDCPTEAAFFSALGMDVPGPQMRTGAWARRVSRRLRAERQMALR